MHNNSIINRLNHILSVSPAIIYACRASGDFGATFVSENITKHLGYSVQECLDNPAFWRENIHPDDCTRVFEGFDSLIEDGFLTHEYRFRKNDGSFIWVLDHIHVIRDHEGMPVELMGSWLDITEQKKAEEALLKIDKLKSEFVSTAAHELRTPLTSIMGFTDLLSDQAFISCCSEEQKNEFLHHINDSCERLNKTVDNLLDVSRIESGQKLPLDKKTQSIKALLENIVKRFKLRANHKITLDIKRGTPEMLEFDTYRLDQVVENLLVNSIKYSPKEGAITIVTESIDGQCKFTVIDQGIGMSDEQKSQVFDKFYRADSSNTAIEGVGLGMCIVKQTIEDHGGRIWIDSVPDDGTQVYFTLPI